MEENAGKARMFLTIVEKAERAGNRGGGAGASRERPGARFKFALGMPCGSDYSAFTYEELPRAADGD